KGTFQDQPFRLSIKGGSILVLREGDRPYPISLDASIGRTKGHLDGTLTKPLELEGLDVNMKLEGRDMAELFPIFGIPLPPTPAYSLAGKLQHKDAVWSFEDFKGKVGDSDLAGDLSVDSGPKPPYMKANLVSRNLDYHSVAGFVGAEPSAPKSGSKREKQAAK